MSYNLKSASATNLKGLSEISVSFDPSLTYLVGPNGSAKSTIGLDILWITMQGVGTKAASKDSTPVIAERYQVIGAEGKSAKTNIVLHDIQKNYDISVTRKITKDGTELSFDAPDDIVLDQRFLNELFSLFLISPQKFIALTPREQSIALGIDLSDIDKSLKSVKDEFTIINRQIRDIGTLTEVPRCESVDVSALVAEKTRRLEYNRIQETIRLDRNDLTERLESCEAEFTEYQTSLQELIILRDTIKATCKGFKSKGAVAYLRTYYPILEQQINEFNISIPNSKDYITEYSKKLNLSMIPQELLEIDELDNQIASASEINVNANKYAEYVKSVTRRDKLIEALDENKRHQEILQSQRTEKIKSFNLPFADLTINDDGELMLQGRYLKKPNFSTGELIKTVPMLIIASMKSMGKDINLPYTYVEDFSLLDEDNQQDIINFFAENNIQCCLEIVSKQVGNEPNHIYLRESKIVTE